MMKKNIDEKGDIKWFHLFCVMTSENYYLSNLRDVTGLY